jgi:sulfite dehydrogenase (cytochrome) subunit A
VLIYGAVFYEYSAKVNLSQGGLLMKRREFLSSFGGVLSVSALSPGFLSKAFAAGETTNLPFANGRRPLVAYPGKRPLIQLTARPPQLETPFNIFDESILTPNDAFFVRYHMADIPLSIDPEKFLLTIKGNVERALSLTLQDLKSKFDPIEIVAVNQCSGNSRGFIEPRVAGGQLGNGAMGNARWKGVSLRALLDRAGLQAGAKEVTFAGLDGPVLPETPDFVKALDLDHARDGEVMVAYAMNGEDLPWLNGYPLRLVVPGFYGTYWVKHLNEINVIDHNFDGYWMTKGYRIPANNCACTEPGQSASASVPINRFNVRSFITNLKDGASYPAEKDIIVQGIAFDGGSGVKQVLLSSDNGATWRAAELGDDYGKYSFRQWRSSLKLPKGMHNIKVCATNHIGQSQPMQPLWNAPGYMRNAVETVQLHGV